MSMDALEKAMNKTRRFLQQGAMAGAILATIFLCACAGPPNFVADAGAETPPAAAPAVTKPSLEPSQRSCKTSADCAVKDIGNCCGTQPACVNKDAQTFPERVKAQCAKDGRVGICGFRPVTGCECVEGQCNDIGLSYDSGVVQ
jgi:hypothetical protein